MILIISNIIKNLRKLREVKIISKEKLARLTDVANNIIIKIEVGKTESHSWYAQENIDGS